jgi:hypothetical protein
LAAMAAMVGATSTSSLCRGVSGGVALASSFTGDKVRVSAGVASAFPGKSVQIVAEALRDGVGASAPWDAQRASTESALSSLATEISAVATEFASASLFGLTEGLESDEEYGEESEGEVIHVDNESVDDEDELAVANLGIPAAVVEALANRGIERLFPIQVRRPVAFFPKSIVMIGLRFSERIEWITPKQFTFV